MRRFALIVVPLVALAHAPKLAAVELAAPPGAAVPLERTRNGRLAIPVDVAGERMEWALDTGATMTMIAAPLALRLGLRCAEELDVTDASGALRAACAGGPLELSVGGERLRLDEAAWFPAGDGYFEREGLGGVVGADAFARVDLALDAETGRVRIAPAGALSPWFEGEEVPVALVAGRPAIRVELRDLDRRPVAARLVLDTGTDRTILFGALAARVAASRGRAVAAVQLASAHANRDVGLALLGRAWAGRAALRLGRAALLPELEWREEDGLLPLSAVGPVVLELAAGRMLVGARRLVRPTPRPVAIAASDR